MMIRAFHSSATGMSAQQLVLDNTANNLANVNTTGFKRSTMDFQDLLYATLRPAGASAVPNQYLPTGLQVGNGVRAMGNTKLFNEGTLQRTDNQLDLAVQGNGLFQIAPPNGSGQFLYTRAGNFHTNANGDVVTVDGYYLQPRLNVPSDTIQISVGNDGTVSVIRANSPTTSSTIGQVTLARFINPAGLSSEGSNYFSQTPASGQVTLNTPGQNGTGNIQGGFLEQSNVDVVSELVNLIQAQRAYEFNTKAIMVADQMLSATNDLVR
jgi:flagellar basal-body rod protein FlgG